MDDDANTQGMTLTVPVFPLPNSVFFPKTFLPLHIFEKRYREMVRDALRTDKLIAMALLEDGWEDHYYQTPDVHPIACVGKIEFSEKLTDGTYNILLFGLYKVKILSFPRSQPYRTAEVQIVEDLTLPLEPEALAVNKERLIVLAREIFPSRLSSAVGDLDTITEMDFESLVNTLAMTGPFSEKDKQSMLECPDVLERSRTVEILLREQKEVRTYIKSLPYIVPDDPQNN